MPTRHGRLENGRDLWMVSLDGEPSATEFHATPFQDRGARFSPDGQWVAYVSDESGQDEVYIRPYLGRGGQVQVSRDGGKEPVWSPDGSELFYRNGRQMLAVGVEARPTLRTTASELLFEGDFELDRTAGGIGGIAYYDVRPDGQRFVMIQTVTGPEDTSRIHVIQNWMSELQQIVPID